MIKPFPNLLSKENSNLVSSKNSPKVEENVKSKPLIIFGFVISLTSIFLLFLTFNINFDKKKDINDYELFSLKITDSLYKKDIGKFLETLSSHFI